MKYVNLIIDNKTDATDIFYTYGCRDDSIALGCKVKVPFAKGNKWKDAYVFEVMDQLQEPIRGLKFVEEIDPLVRLTPEILETCRWMKRRLSCRYIDAIKQFTPAGKPSKRGLQREPYKDHPGEAQAIESLNQDQKHVLDALTRACRNGENQLFLLNGVTGSGKTEVYMQAISACLRQGRTCIMMVPEIALTKQIIDRFAGRFGSGKMAVLHSGLSAGQRFDEWIRIREGRAPIVIGARSAVFAPLENIGLIILDEEHEPTYKSDMTPKYDTMDVAAKRAKAWSGVLLAGSATPSVVTRYRSDMGIFKRLDLPFRYNLVPLPKVDVVDMRKELLEGNRSILSRELFDALTDTLGRGEQAILFHNRRGFATYLACPSCGLVDRCPTCGISMTYHKDQDKMVCHYCGASRKRPVICPSCGGAGMRLKGTGTEKVEETIGELFPEAITERLDLDAVRKKGALESILDRFGSGEIHVLVGTQLVAKGLDFKNVGLVGIISADVLLRFPDFRSPERAFQLITQAAGRAGRGDKPGKVIIQTTTPDHYAITAAAAQNYQQFYGEELRFREYMEYPPFSELILLTFDGETEEIARKCACAYMKQYTARLPGELSKKILPAQSAGRNRKGGLHRVYVIIKSPQGRKADYMNVFEEMKSAAGKGKKNRCLVAADINPYSLWRN